MLAALAFARQGAPVVVSAGDEGGVVLAVEHIRSYGGDAMAVTTDVTYFAHVQAQRAKN
jgi:NAD(P)-dependent dehydrogenase (short-subunit alcohol dehydrogenase family)